MINKMDNNNLNKLPNVHEAFVNVATQIRQKNPKTSLSEAFEEAHEPFKQSHGIEYDYSYRTFLNHYYEKK